MKHFIRILFLAVALFTGLMTVSAQKVQVLVYQKVPALPVTITNYIDEPFRYFNIQFVVTGAEGDGVDVFFDMELSVDSNPLYVRTLRDVIPSQPIHLHNGINKMSGDELNTQVLHRVETNYDYSNPLEALQLPEGTYQLCVDFYLWSDRFNPDRVPITLGPCPKFEVCYSGSAPELVSPMAGTQMALNGALVVTPSRKVNFFWSPVISNCAGRNARFKYKLKVVKVLDGQNYNDAIKHNPTVFSAEVRNGNHAILDTLRDIKVPFEKGALYVAQVQAEQIVTSRSEEPFVIANEGVSQPTPFFWIEAPEGYSRMYTKSVEEEDDDEDDESEGVVGVTQWEGGEEEESELETILDEMKEQYLASFIQDASTIASLTEAYPDERKYVPTPKRRYVESDGYYTIPMVDDWEVSFMPARHNSLKNVSYDIELYDYVSGGIDSITSYEPLFSENVAELPESYNKMDSHELVSRTLAGWGSDLEQGSLYYLQLTSYYTVGYWKYVIADTSYFVNERLAEHFHDTVSREFVEEKYAHSNGVFFQWGDDPDAPEFKTPQWKAPVDRTGDDIYDPSSYVIPAVVPEIQKAKSFPVSWTPVQNVSSGDQVEYEVNVYELKPGQTLEEAISENEVLVSRTVIDANEIDETDTKFFKVFSSKKTYVITLSTSVDGDSETIYHFENGNEALPIVIKIVK